MKPMTTPMPRAHFALVLVAAQPEAARLVTSLGRAVEPLVHAPQTVHAARIGGISVVDDAFLVRERTHPRPIALERGHVGSRRGRDLGLSPRAATHLTRSPLDHRLTPIVVFNAPIALIILGERYVEVEVE